MKASTARGPSRGRGSSYTPGKWTCRAKEAITSFIKSCQAKFSQSNKNKNKNKMRKRGVDPRWATLNLHPKKIKEICREWEKAMWKLFGEDRRVIMFGIHNRSMLTTVSAYLRPSMILNLINTLCLYIFLSQTAPHHGSPHSTFSPSFSLPKFSLYFKRTWRSQTSSLLACSHSQESRSILDLICLRNYFSFEEKSKEVEREVENVNIKYQRER